MLILRGRRPNSPHRSRSTPAVAVSAALLVSLTAGATACGSGSKASSTGPLQVWVRGNSDSAAAYRQLANRFTAQTGIKVSLFNTVTDFETRLNAVAAARNLPDVVVDDGSQLGAFKSQGYIQPVNRTAITGNQDVAERAWSFTQATNGKYYAIPFSVQAQVLYVRQDWLDKLKLKAPTTWPEFVNVAKAFTTKDPDGDGKADTYGLAVPGSTVRGYTAYGVTTFLWDNGGDFLKKTGSGTFTADVNSPASVSAVKAVEDLFCTVKVVQPGALTADTNASNAVFSSGRAGMYLSGAYSFPMMDKAVGKSKYTVVAPPTGTGTADLAEGTDIYLMSGSGKAAQARKLAEYMISAPGQRLAMTLNHASPIVRLPVNRNVDVGAVRNDPRWALTQRLYATLGRPTDAVPNYPAVQQLAANGLNGIFAQCPADPQSALDKLAGEINTELRKEGVSAS